MGYLFKLGRNLFPGPLFSYPFYLLKRSPGKEGSHMDPKCDLFTEAEGPLVGWSGGQAGRQAGVL